MEARLEMWVPAAVTVTTHAFDATPNEVFRTLTDAAHYPDWLVGAKHIRHVSPDWPAVGSHFKHRVGFGPATLPDRTSVRAIEPDRRLELFVRARPLLEAHVEFTLEPQGSGCVLTMTETPAGLFKLLAPLTQPLVKARNERSIQRLVELVERTPRGVARG